MDTPSIADFPNDGDRLKEWQRRRMLSEERERASRLMARYEEGSPLTNDEWMILAFTPAPDGFASGCGY